MDFSEVDRALASLSRRQPPLPNEVLDLSNRLLELFVTLSSLTTGNKSDPDLHENDEYTKGILRLIDLGSSASSSFVRWEPLAVGLRLVVDYLERKTNALPKVPVGVGLGEEVEEDDDNNEEDEGTGLGTGGGGVYAEGPRIPKISGMAAAATAVVVDPTTTSTEDKSFLPSANSPVFELMWTLPTIIDENVEHSEPRVRSLVAQTVGAYARYATSLLNWLGHFGKNDVDKSCRANDEEWKMLEEAIRKTQIGRRSIHSAILISLKKHLGMKEPVREEGKHNQSKASDGALDDTTGWRALETNLHGLASYVDGCVGRAGTNFYEGGSYIAEEISLFQAASSSLNDVSWFLSGLQHCCVVHVNRHVRAASAAVLGVLVKVCMRSRDASHHTLLVEVDSPFRLVLKESLRATLADNWSQVRMAGSVLCRRLVGALIKIHARGGRGDDDNDEEEDVTVFESSMGDLVPMLLPRMCLNRFYMAQGVKLYSQDTWKLVFGTVQGYSPEEEGLHSSEETKGGGGLGAVARNAASVCRYYSKMCDADNHAVREAACQGVAELAQKVGKHPMYAEHLSPHVTMLLQVSCIHYLISNESGIVVVTLTISLPSCLFLHRLC